MEASGRSGLPPAPVWAPRADAGSDARSQRPIWTATLFLVAIGLAAVLRRAYVLLAQHPLSAGLAAPLDAGFARHRDLTLAHIIPASLFVLLAPLQFVERLRRGPWHRWSGRGLLVIGAVTGATALVMSYTTAIGGANETAATTFFAVLFLLFLGAGFREIRRYRVREHREWMTRAFGVALGASVTRPIIGAFFAARRLPPHEFFGIGFWLGFSISLLGAEAWIHYSAGKAPLPELLQ